MVCRACAEFAPLVFATLESHIDSDILAPVMDDSKKKSKPAQSISQLALVCAGEAVSACAGSTDPFVFPRSADRVPDLPRFGVEYRRLAIAGVLFGPQ
jgi:hypothetical protein